MKRTLAVIVSLALSSPALQAQLILYNFAGAAGNEVAFPANFSVEHLHAGLLTRGSGLTPTASADTFSSSGFTLAGAPDANDYYAFTLAPDDGYQMSLSGLELDERRSSTGIRQWSVRSSLDGFGADLGLFTVPDDTATRVNQATSLGFAFQELASPVEFRIYGFGAEGASGTWRIDNLEMMGSVSPIPEPGTCALMFGFGLVVFAWGRRRIVGG